MKSKPIAIQGKLETAILLLAFNRPEYTRKVFDSIRTAKPDRLYVAIDGPRKNKPAEAAQVASVREIVTNIDWPCQLVTLFREENLGCKNAVSSAITWFFRQEEKGIILEDDCLPSPSFFFFCEHMLNHYEKDLRIWMVAGFNPRYPGVTTSEYFASENPSVWGWATWANRWEQYDVTMNCWENNKLKQYLQLKFPDYIASYYSEAFDSTSKGMIDTWDYQFTLTILANHGMVLKPRANLISNIGIEGHHSSTKDHNHWIQAGSVNVDQLTFHDNLFPDLEEDFWFYSTRLPTTQLPRFHPSRLKLTLKKIAVKLGILK